MTAPHRILHVLDHSLPHQSGYVFRTLGILAAQRARGWRTFHLTTPKQGPSPADGRREEVVDGWSFFRTAPPSSIVGRLPLAGLAAQILATRRRLEEVIPEVRPGILHAHSPVLNGIPAAAAGARFDIPVVYEVRAFWEDAAVDHGATREGSLRYRSSQWLETRMLRRAAAVTTLCEGMRQAIVARGIPAEKVTVIPNAVDIDRFSTDRDRDPALAAGLGLEGAAVIGFVGSFYRYEGLDLLLAAMPALVRRFPKLKLLLVGGGPEEENLRRQAAGLDLGRSVVFTGRVPHDAVKAYYDLIDVFAYPRHRMRLTELVTPLKPLEAMAQARAVVASDVGGHRELVAPGETGFLFPADDVDALTACLARAIEGTGERHRIAAAARRFVERERTWHASAARYEEVYARATGRETGQA
ncbi:MAG TPA: TIGR04063 family PEP-CTERM/XrtA system glycosyltransferase [Alphaproteobacteria bacterium]|nr:TIGR04063 family PEP-CTERM/XrtA system glycosyltransferase [Alphaproteobacteria bacterium]